MIALGMLLCVVRVGGGEETGKKLGGIQKKIEKQREWVIIASVKSRAGLLMMVVEKAR